MPPVVRVVDRQDVAQEMMDERPELLGRARRSPHRRLRRHLEPAPMRVEDRLDVELLLVAEVVVDRRQVRPAPARRSSGPRATRTPSRRTPRPPPPATALSSHLVLPSSCSVPNTCFKQTFQSTVSFFGQASRRIEPFRGRPISGDGSDERRISTCSAEFVFYNLAIMQVDRGGENPCMHSIGCENRQPADRPVYAVFGDDHVPGPRVDEAIVRAVFPEADDEAAVRRFSGAGRAGRRAGRVRTLPFFCRRRLVIVEEADPFVTKHRKELEAYVVKPGASGTCSSRSSNGRRPPSWPSWWRRWAWRSSAMPCPRSRRQVVAWLTQYARTRCDAQLDPGAANLWSSWWAWRSESWRPRSRSWRSTPAMPKRIERADVARMVGAGRVETIWKALDAATTGQAGSALESRQPPGGRRDPDAAAGGDERIAAQGPPRRPAPRCPAHAGRGVPEAGIPPFAVEKTGKQHAHLGPRRVDRLPAMLLQADLDLKGGSRRPPRGPRTPPGRPLPPRAD